MKRFLSILLIFIIISFWVYASGNDDTGLFVGTWININSNTSGGLTYTILDLRQDGTAVCVLKNVHEDGTDFGRNYMGSWKMNGDGIYIKSGNNTSMDAIMTDNGFLAEKTYGGYIMYSRVKQYNTSDPEQGLVSVAQLETGVRIPTGTYIIGEDIPAGTYRFEMRNTTSKVEYFDNKSSLFPSTSFDLNARSETYGRLSMAEGGVLKISISSIILSYARSLFE